MMIVLTAIGLNATVAIIIVAKNAFKPVAITAQNGAPPGATQ